MYKIEIDTNTCILEDREEFKVDNYKLIEEFSNTISITDWLYLCKQKDFIDAVSDGDYNKVKLIARKHLIIK